LGKARGLKGEIFFDWDNSKSSNFKPGIHVGLAHEGKSDLVLVTLHNIKPCSDRWTVQFRELTSLDSVQPWVLATVFRRRLDEEKDDIFWSDCQGLKLFDGEIEIGRLGEFLQTPSGQLFFNVHLNSGKVGLLPLESSWVASLDKKLGRLIMQLPPGLVDLWQNSL
jgi:ribosomal 30S subunit maturation factor RimM